MVKKRVKNEEISEMIEKKGLRATADYLVKQAGYTISSTYGKLRDLVFLRISYKKQVSTNITLVQQQRTTTLGL